MKHQHTKPFHTSVATDLNSAPVVLGHKRAIKSNRMSRSTLMLHNKRLAFGRLADVCRLSPPSVDP